MERNNDDTDQKYYYGNDSDDYDYNNLNYNNNILQLGLSVLTSRPRGRVKTSLGGEGVDPRDTVKMLEGVTVKAPKGTYTTSTYYWISDDHFI